MRLKIINIKMKTEIKKQNSRKKTTITLNQSELTIKKTKKQKTKELLKAIINSRILK